MLAVLEIDVGDVPVTVSVGEVPEPAVSAQGAENAQELAARGLGA